MGFEAAILIVEDSFLTAEAYRAALEEAGYSDIRTAARPQAALEEAARRRPDLAIVDLNLDGRRPDGGLDLARELQGAGVAQVILATGYRAEGLDVGALLRPPVAILQKPVATSDLLAAVRRCLEA